MPSESQRRIRNRKTGADSGGEDRVSRTGNDPAPPRALGHMRAPPARAPTSFFFLQSTTTRKDSCPLALQSQILL
ncbi:hypothetical protein BC834DRAFT_479260 [Gloeopeniophorella convolvens]|nr:hypothetical protein BC834DRAFT_479260 [Gloeopeniophorella convolvens]